jgi:hypothetical protein
MDRISEVANQNTNNSSEKKETPETDKQISEYNLMKF